jgi:hypothetical protein
MYYILFFQFVIILYLFFSRKRDAEFLLEVGYNFYSMLCKEKNIEPSFEQYQEMVLVILKERHEKRMRKHGLKTNKGA